MNKKGFTLIELLVVVLIIGILAAIAVPQYQKAVAKSKFANLKLMVNSIEKAQEAYYLAHGNYANNFNDLDITMPIGKQGEEVASVNTIEYDWGVCVTNEYHVICQNSSIGMQLDHYFAQSTKAPGKQVCTIEGTMDLTDYRNEICKQETRATTSKTSKPDNVIFWIYQPI